MGAERTDRVLKPGKVPPDTLARVLSIDRGGCAELVVGPAAGEDAAVLRFGKGLVAVTSDPITFRTPRPGRFAICVNANDVAAMGARPRYCTVAVLLPPGSSESSLMALMEDLVGTAREHGIVLVGGHTEVTEAVRWPVLCVTMFGGLLRADPLRSGGAQAGDAILQVGPLAVEGTAILAETQAERLVSELGGSVVTAGMGLLEHPGICVVAPALVLAQAPAVHALHDPTEGGLATGLREMAQAAGLGVLVEEACLLVRPETEAICRCLGYDPLGLISSGCLLAAVAPAHVERVILALAAQGHAGARIGAFVRDASMVLVRRDGKRETLPTFAVDELARE
jgi:hydrogenase maturation factor